MRYLALYGHFPEKVAVITGQASARQAHMVASAYIGLGGQIIRDAIAYCRDPQPELRIVLTLTEGEDY